jgi:putative ATP-dependent endonuclease of OLD family
MYLERLTITNFRCFGPEPHSIEFGSSLTAFVGANGSGKTAVMHALLRLFGVTNDQRRIRRQDFHVSTNETTTPKERSLVIEAVLAFPELDSNAHSNSATVPEFFHQMAADEGGKLKCRLRLEANWTDDGSLDGSIEAKYRAVRTLNPNFEESECSDITALDRARVQVVYVPAVRDGVSQVTAFLRGRLWRAIAWSNGVQDVLANAGKTLNDAFGAELGVDIIAKAVERRWQEVHTAGTDTTPIFRPIDLRFQEFIRKVEVTFRPDESGRERHLEDLSDGQRSLFHIAMTAATLDIEAKALSMQPSGFQADGIALPSLTLIAVEEPENNLAPFYLSRIVRQIQSLTAGQRAQSIISSHSASILARVDPVDVRHFRLDPKSRTAQSRAIRLPASQDEAGKFIREAVQSYPELYFARFVILGEGSSEEVVLPRLAAAMDLPIDRSFVAVVPLGGRHVNHLWRLLTDLDIPHATLLDLDVGRLGGGWGRIKNACQELLANGVSPQMLFGDASAKSAPEAILASFDNLPLESGPLWAWVIHLRQFGVFYCWALDLDWSMLRAFPEAYQKLDEGMKGPSSKGDAKSARTAVLGDDDKLDVYPAELDEIFRWYRYLFLGRGKPTTHVRALGKVSAAELKAKAPDELRLLLKYVEAALTAAPTSQEQ